MRIWDRSIATQFICLMLFALLLSQAISFLIRQTTSPGMRCCKARSVAMADRLSGPRST